MRTLRHLAPSLALALAVLVPASASADKPKLHLERADTTKYPLIKTYLSFVEADGHIATGKTKENFKLVFDSNEGAAASDLKSFDQVTEPVFVVVVAQLSGAMHEVFDDEKKGIRNIVDAAATVKGSKIALIGYSQDTKRLAELGKPEEVGGAVSGMTEDTEGTEVHLLDAVRTALDLMNSKGVPDEGRKLIVVFSDGIDVGGMDKRGFADLGKRAVGQNIVIDTVGYAPFEPGKLKNLFELSKQTNGSERVVKSPQETSATFANIADEITKQYVALFQSSFPGDGKEHTVQVVSEGTIYSNNISRTCVQAAGYDTVEEKPWYKRWWFYLICGVLLLALIGLVVMLIMNREPKEAPAEPEPAPAPAPKAAAPQMEMRTMAVDLGSIGGIRGPSLAWIVGLNGPYNEKTFKLNIRTVIGSSTEADLQLEDPKVSRKHCEIRFEGNTYKLIDLGSTNGVILNEKRAMVGDLVDGDSFRIGGTEFKFKTIN